MAHHDRLVYTDGRLPVWDIRVKAFTDPDTGAQLPSWEQACEELAQPAHVVRFGAQVHVKGILGGTEEAGRHVGYLLRNTSPKASARPLASTNTPPTPNATMPAGCTPNS